MAMKTNTTVKGEKKNPLKRLQRFYFLHFDGTDFFFPSKALLLLSIIIYLGSLVTATSKSRAAAFPAARLGVSIIFHQGRASGSIFCPG